MGCVWAIMIIQYAVRSNCLRPRPTLILLLQYFVNYCRATGSKSWYFSTIISQINRPISWTTRQRTRHSNKTL